MKQNDLIRIIIQVENWKPSPGIPIELSQVHSFTLEEVINPKNKKANRLHSIVCRVNNEVNEC